LYNCALGLLAAGNAQSSLRQEKQAFLLVPAGAKYKRGVATEADDGLDTRSIFADEDEEFLEQQRMARKKRRSTSYGPFYLVATDRIHESASAFRVGVDWLTFER
jgi:hypothetical protein